MTTPSDRRANQKSRTRSAIVQAATELFRQGREPTVAEAAEAAKVSRATAYRYFPTPDSLLLEVTGVTPDYAHLEQAIEAASPVDVEARLTTLVQALNAKIFADEARMRLALKVYLDTWFANRGKSAPKVREGRRAGWIAAALAPESKGKPPAAWRRLQSALALTAGAEAMVVMKDVCDLDEAEAQATLAWAARTLLRAGLTEMRSAKAPKRP